jgi:acetylglutamate/LysW-gamma-L-alpha-aminoadipate kinase
MTNVPGLLSNPEDTTTLLRSIPAERLSDYMDYAKGRMRKKLLGAQEALDGGVKRISIGNRSLLDVLHGAGTTITTLQREENPYTASNDACASMLRIN